MSRQIYKYDDEELVRTPGIKIDKYQDRLVKLIPGDIVTVYLTVKTIIDIVKVEDKTFTIQWIFFFAVLIISPFYLKRVSGVSDIKQISILIIAFIIWAVSLQTPFIGLTPDAPLIGAIFAGLFTLVVPIFYKGILKK